MLKYLLLIVLLAGCSRPKQQLNVFIWPDYVDPQTVTEFEQQHDCKIVIDYYDDNYSMIAKLESGGLSQYDIVSPTLYLVPSMIRRGLLAPLGHTNLPNLANLDPQFANTTFDPENRYSIPYLWGTMGLYTRVPKERMRDESWKLIFDPSAQPGPFALLEDRDGCVEMALKYRGLNPNSVAPSDLKVASELLIEAKQRSLGFMTSTGGRESVISGQAALAIVYSADALRGVRENPETRYILPPEGTGYYVDCLAIPARAPHRRLAEQFLNHVMAAQTAARIARFTFSATPNRAAFALLDPVERTNVVIYPPPEVMRRFWISIDQGENTRLVDEVWTQVKAK